MVVAGTDATVLLMRHVLTVSSGGGRAKHASVSSGEGLLLCVWWTAALFGRLLLKLRHTEGGPKRGGTNIAGVNIAAGSGTAALPYET